MTVTINGTTGIAGTNGSAGTPAVQGEDTNTGIFFPAADTVAVATAGAERLRVDSSGNVGIGTSSPTGALHVSRSGLEAGITLERTTSATAKYTIAANDGNLTFTNSATGTERARIDSSGNLLVGTTSFSAFPTQTTGNMAVFQMGITYGRSPQNASGRYWFYGSEGSAGATYIIYNNNNTGVFLAYGGTAWSANSDERMKTTLVPFEDAVGKVCSLRAGTGRYLTDEEDVSRSFLIAQDVQAVLPEAVDVKEDEQGTLGLRYTDVVPLLVAAIKELKAEVDSLKAQLEAK